MLEEGGIGDPLREMWRITSYMVMGVREGTCTL